MLVWGLVVWDSWARPYQKDSARHLSFPQKIMSIALIFWFMNIEAWLRPRFVAWFSKSRGALAPQCFWALAFLMDVDGIPVTLAETSWCGLNFVPRFHMFLLNRSQVVCQISCLQTAVWLFCRVALGVAMGHDYQLCLWTRNLYRWIKVVFWDDVFKVFICLHNIQAHVKIDNRYQFYNKYQFTLR